MRASSRVRTASRTDGGTDDGSCPARRCRASSPTSSGLPPPRSATWTTSGSFGPSPSSSATASRWRPPRSRRRVSGRRWSSSIADGEARSVVDGTRAVSGEQQHTARDRAGDVHEEPDGGDVDLMDVVEHDQQAVRCGSRGERVGDLDEACEPLDLRLGVRPRVEDVITTESRQHLAPRPERRRPFLLGAPAPHDGDTGGCGDRAQLVGETRLADAWFAAEQDEARRCRSVLRRATPTRPPARCLARPASSPQRGPYSPDEYPR